MSYNKQNFIKGQILKADHLNAMDAGIEANDLAISALSEEIANVGELTNEQVSNAVNAWLDEHPETTILRAENFSDISNYAEKASAVMIRGGTIDTPEVISGLKDVYLRFDPGYPFIWDNQDAWETGYYDNGWVYSPKSALVLSGLENVTFDGLSFIADADDPHILTWEAIRLENCKNVKFVNCNIQGFKWIGIGISNINNADVSICDSLIRRCRFNIYNAGKRTLISGNIITDDYEDTHEFVSNGGAWVSNSTNDSQYYDGIIEAGEDTTILNNRIYQNGQSGVYTSACTNVNIISNIVTENYNIGIDIGAVVVEGDEYKIVGGLVADNFVKENKHVGINVTNAKGIFVNNNKVTSADTSCIVSEGKSVACYFSGNHCYSGAGYGLIFGTNVLENTVINTMGECALGLVFIPASAQMVKNYPYNKLLAEKLVVDVPYDSSSVVKSRTVVNATVDDNVNSQYWVANKPVVLNKTEGGNEFQTLTVGALNCLDQTAQSIWLTKFARLPQDMFNAAGCLWFDPATKKLQYYDGTSVITIATE